MEVCRKIGHYVDPYMPKDYFLNHMFSDGSASPSWFKDGKYKIFHWAFISLTSIVQGEWKGPLNKMNKTEYRGIYSDLLGYVQPFVHKKDMIYCYDEQLHGTLFLQRSALQQFKYQQYPLVNLYKYQWLFKQVEDVFKDVFRYSYDCYVQFGIAMFLFSQNSISPLLYDNILDQIGQGNKMNRETVGGILANLSSTRGEIIANYNIHRSEDDRLAIYDFNPLMQTPIVRSDEFCFFPVPILIYSAITEGFYHKLCDEKGLGFRTDFGRILENYIDHLFSRCSVGFTIIKEFSYGSPEKKSPDFILVEDHSVIFIEVKANSPTAKYRAADADTFKQKLIDAYGNSLLQCAKKQNDYEDGTLFHECLPQYREITKIYYLALTLEDFYLPSTSYVKEILVDYCGTEGFRLDETVGFYCASIRELEFFLQCYSESLFEIIETLAQVRAISGVSQTPLSPSRPLNETLSFKYWESEVNNLSKDLFQKEIG